MKFLIPKLSGNEYANLITAFAVIIAVEYTSGAYDAWDGFVGLLAIGLGYLFINDAKTKNDFWYSFITASLISLGIVSILSLVFYMATGYSEPTGKEKFEFELVRFFIFICAASVIWYKWVKNEAVKANT